MDLSSSITHNYRIAPQSAKTSKKKIEISTPDNPRRRCLGEKFLLTSGVVKIRLRRSVMFSRSAKRTHFLGAEPQTSVSQPLYPLHAARPAAVFAAYLSMASGVAHNVQSRAQAPCRGHSRVQTGQGRRPATALPDVRRRSGTISVRSCIPRGTPHLKVTLRAAM